MRSETEPAGRSGTKPQDPLRIAVLVPCYNEETAIAQVIAGFRAALPAAAIYVYDNNSTDGTVAAARAAGATVRGEAKQGKGNVVRRMFADVEADVYVLVDGDATYDVLSAPAMISDLIGHNRDMVVAARISREEAAYRRGHRAGNRLLTSFVASVFDSRFTDVLSGGFEIETELTIHALELDLPVGEIQTPYYARPTGSQSKLNTWRDGFRILWTIMRLYRSERPLNFFSGIAAFLAISSIGLATPVIVTYLEVGLVPRLPTAVLATGMMLAAFLAIAAGLILDTVTRGRREVKLLAYLAQRGLEERRKTSRA